jgi:SAM-dependent methyltransferase
VSLTRQTLLRRQRLIKAITPPAPLIANPVEQIDAPLGRWNLYIGGAGNHVPGYVNVDLFGEPGVDVVADAHLLPFTDATFTRVECDAVLEHVKHPHIIAAEIERVLVVGGYAHFVVPFCHPFHEYPRDYQRFTPDGLRVLLSGFEIVSEGWRTGPTATLLIFVLEWFKLLLPWRAWRIVIHGVLGWILFPLRYLDVFLLRSPYAGRMGNHYFMWVRKSSA